jgi:hypothetical protein
MDGSELLPAMLYIAGAGMAALASALAAMRRPTSKAYQAVSGLFVVLVLNSIINTLLLTWPGMPLWLMLVQPALIAMTTPLLWAYVDDLSAAAPRVWRWRDLLPFSIAAALAMVPVALLLVSLMTPIGGAERATVPSDLSFLPIASSIGMLAAIVQASIYVASIVRHLLG